jgi:uncharacterized protein DUF5916
MGVGLRAVCVLAIVAAPRAALAQSTLSGATIQITRAAGRITIDGDLSDEGWQGATRVDKWFETQPGDNVEPKVKNVGYLTFDDRFLYAAFEFEDPNPAAIRAPFADRDNIGNGYNDYGGILLDARATGSTAVFFVVTPRNIQYDSITDDSSGEDSSPDFFWDSATRIGPHGWTLEMRIPFSSIRYRNVDPQTWHILLYRNYPRDFHYQYFSARLPRDGNCFVCRSNVLTGLERLPKGGHLVVAPFATLTELAQPAGDLGTPLGSGTLRSVVGVDLKYLPNADNAVDLAIKPDFSQVESDTAQIATNQRFALFFPEKRPFFLEGIDLFATPIQAVYTRTITAPVAGGRLTGKEGGVRYTVLVADDDGGGSAVLPGPTSSSLASVDFGSTVFVARLKRDLGLSFVGLLATDREHRDGEGHNRVVGPDAQWRPRGTDVVSAQWLFSDTKTPNHPDLADEWTGQTFAGHAGVAQWSHNATHLDWFALYRDISGGFRADTGFVPQVGYREANGSTGWTFRPTNLLSRVRTFLNVDEQVDHRGALISRDVQPGFGMDSKLNGFMQFRFIDDRIQTPGGVLIDRRQFGYVLQFSPSQLLAQIAVNGTLGQDIDFDNSRPGEGPTVNLSATIRPTNHLELALVANQQSLNVDDAAGASRRLFRARVSRVRGTYTFTSRLFLRSIAQYVATDRNPTLYRDSVDARSGDFSGSVLLAYKVNWQSVMYVGYGDDRELTTPQPVPIGPPIGRRLAPLDRQFFVKLSYAVQR